jgi:hypothetical protein
VISNIDAQNPNLPRSPAIYLHWNGDAASVRGFLLAAEEMGLGLPDDMGLLKAQESLMDSLAHMIATRFFGPAHRWQAIPGRAGRTG